MGCCGGTPSIYYPNKFPSSGGGGGGGGSSSGSAIQNGRLAPRRNAFFSRRLHRVSQLIQHPGSIDLREFCVLVWALYASYQLYFSGRAAWHLLASVDVRLLCGAGQSFVGCGWDLLWRVLYILYLYLANVVPWAILAAGAAFVGEEVMRNWS